MDSSYMAGMCASIRSHQLTTSESDRKQSSVAKLSMMKSAAVCMVCSQLDRILRITSFTEVGCTCLYADH
jgi:hypothetical protein